MKELVSSMDAKCRALLDKSRLTHPIYEKVILPLEAILYRKCNTRLSKVLEEAFGKAVERYVPAENRRDAGYMKRMKKDFMQAHIAFRMSEDEYFLYDFFHQDYWQCFEWLTDKERFEALDARFGDAVFQELKDKATFYRMTKPYFRRDVSFVDASHPVEDFLQFAGKHHRFIAKPIDGSLGADTFIAEVKDQTAARAWHEEMVKRGAWIVEDLIVQHPETASWNASSVNTLRVPSFRYKGDFHILQPFFRTGRHGSVVDNAGHGGIFAVFDPSTGIITTDGVDEWGGRFRCHPDSQKVFKGWQIPLWNDLVQLVKEVHGSLPEHHRYVGFDFALNSDKQWVLVEGNWGQMVGQMAELKGIRKQFIEYIS